MTDPQTPPAPSSAPADAPTDAPQTPPAQTPPPAQQTPQSARDNFDAKALMDSVNSLPERIVNAIREATQPQTPPAPAQSAASGDGKTSGGDDGQQTPGKRTYKSFGHRWFGITE